MSLENDNLLGRNSREKYFDIIFNTSRNLVEDELASNLHKIAALELLLEDVLGKDKNIGQIVQNYTVENNDTIVARQTNLFIAGMGNILTKNE